MLQRAGIDTALNRSNQLCVYTLAFDLTQNFQRCSLSYPIFWLHHHTSLCLQLLQVPAIMKGRDPLRAVGNQ